MAEQTRIFLVIEETRFFHPKFVNELLESCPYPVVGAAVVKTVPRKNSIDYYLRSHWYYLRPGEIAKLVLRKVSIGLKEVLGLGKGVEFYSVQSVLDAKGVESFEVHKNINKDEYLSRIEAARPDIILSSNSLIFRKRILNIPKLCCLNRHSALLPAYGGVWPVFQAMRSGESHTGVSVHLMDQGIDTGEVVSQEAIPIRSGETAYTLYEKCYEVSARVCLAAIEKAVTGNLEPVTSEQIPSYYSWPTADHWKEFRKRGFRFV